jgi:hypothetical protein
MDNVSVHSSQFPINNIVDIYLQSHGTIMMAKWESHPIYQS